LLVQNNEHRHSQFRKHGKRCSSASKARLRASAQRF
jgi:hypothetical protein